MTTEWTRTLQPLPSILRGPILAGQFGDEWSCCGFGAMVVRGGLLGKVIVGSAMIHAVASFVT